MERARVIIERERERERKGEEDRARDNNNGGIMFNVSARACDKVLSRILLIDRAKCPFNARKELSLKSSFCDNAYYFGHGYFA